MYLPKLCRVSRQKINTIENNKYDPILELAFSLTKNLGVTLLFNVLFSESK
ncbi:transcriptional regulator [Bacillus wiedmannii]|uniref:Transcriptional regulator n=1 Tax=Bacillus wiedmannii TaxID=1890302 RepID=A0AA95LVG5_9BACI|nr:transcriptional regulator [Bacillus wiedmannii]WHY30899.1 transcriptional regulator [Bacillus wiedmannii]